MKEPILKLVFSLLLFKITFAGAQNFTHMEEKKIKELLQNGYLNGALNKMNTEAMRQAYHPDFAIFFAEGNELKKLTLENWIVMVENFKTTDRGSGMRKFECEFVQIDVVETAAFVKLKLTRRGQLIFTDLITLLKFEGEWKIVTKIYHAHVEDPWKL